MKDLNQISIKRIIGMLEKKGIDLKFKSADVRLFCNDSTTKDLLEKEDDDSKMKRLLISNESKIDKSKLLFVVWAHYREGIEEFLGEIGFSEDIDYRYLDIELRNLQDEIKRVKKNPKAFIEKNTGKKVEDKLNEMIYYNEQVSTVVDTFQKLEHKLKDLQYIQNLLKDNTVYLTNIFYDKDNRVQMRVYNCEEFISAEEAIRLTEKEKENREIFEKLEKELTDVNNTFPGMNYVLQAVDGDDLEYVMPKEIAVSAGVKTDENIQFNIKSNSDKEFSRPDFVIPEVKQTIEELLKYIDMPKLLLLSIYKFEVLLKNKNDEIYSNDLNSTKIIAEALLNYIPEDTILDTEPKYSVDDVKKLLARIDIDNGLYITKEETEELKKDLLEGYDLANLPEENLPILRAIMFSKQELEEIMYTSPENFAFAAVLLKLEENEIVRRINEKPKYWTDDFGHYLLENDAITTDSLLELYYNGAINIESILNSELEDLPSKINIDTLKQGYKEYIEDKSKENKDEKAKHRYEAMLDLYKIVHLDDKDEQEKAEMSENIMSELAELIEDEEDMFLIYEKGLVTLETIVEWNGDIYARKLYQDGKITFEDMEKLFKEKKIDQKIIQEIVLQKEPETYDGLMENILKGYYTEDKIIDLYMQGKIFDVDLEEIARQGHISSVSYLDATKNRTMEILEENSNIKLKLTNVPYKKEINGIEIEEGIEEGPDSEDVVTSPDAYNFSQEDNNKTLIDPFARYKYLEMLGAIPAETFGIDEDNAFYHYEFFVIPDENGKLQSNSVVIAERILEDINHPEKGLATNNATYFFQYKDLMVNSNLTKKEMIQERNKVVAKANHRIGSWAISVLYKIAMIQRASDLTEFKKGDEKRNIVLDELHKLYSSENILKILNLAEEIDDYTMHDIEIEEGR